MVEISLGIQGKTKGAKKAFIDDTDYELVSKYRWHEYKCKESPHRSYAIAYMVINGKKRRVRMHCLIMNTHKGQLVDHFNGNGLDNRRSNLRICTNRENQLNTIRNRHLDNHGVHKFRDRYQSKISINSRQIHLGTFLTEAEAVAAYQAAQRIEVALVA